MALSAAMAVLPTLGLALAATLISAPPASAHTDLVSITPEPGARLTAAPTKVVLVFNQSVSPPFASVVVTTADGVPVTRGKPAVTGATVSQALSEPLGPGAYRVAFRVVSKDGHPVTGESIFTVRSRTTSGPSPSASSSPAVPSPSPSGTSLVVPTSAAQAQLADSGGQGGQGGLSPGAVAMGGGVGLLVLGAIVVLLRRRERS